MRQNTQSMVLTYSVQQWKKEQWWINGWRLRPTISTTCASTLCFIWSSFPRWGSQETQPWLRAPSKRWRRCLTSMSRGSPEVPTWPAITSVWPISATCRASATWWRRPIWPTWSPAGPSSMSGGWIFQTGQLGRNYWNYISISN